MAFVAAQLGDTIQAKAIAATLPARAAISRGEVVALVARARGDTATWISELQATAKADEARVHLGPPSVSPPHEMLGDALLALRRPKEAIEAYEKELQLMPNRSHSLRMLAWAQRETGDASSASRTEAKLKANWHAEERIRSH